MASLNAAVLLEIHATQPARAISSRGGGAAVATDRRLVRRDLGLFSAHGRPGASRCRCKKVSAVRLLEIEFRAHRHNACGVDGFVALIIVMLDVHEIHRGLDIRPLIELARIGP